MTDAEVMATIVADPAVVAAQTRVDQAKANLAAVEGWLRDMPTRWAERENWQRQLPSFRAEVYDAEEALRDLVAALVDLERSERHTRNRRRG